MPKIAMNSKYAMNFLMMNQIFIWNGSRLLRTICNIYDNAIINT